MLKMKKFKWATVSICSNNMQVIYSDADTPVDHTNACVKDELGLPHDETVIHVNGFSGPQEAFTYCKERGLTVV